MVGYVLAILWNIRGYLKYSIVGMVGLGVHMATLWLLTEKLSLWYLLSATIAIIVAALNNYILNYYWTFSDRKSLITNQFTGYFKYLLSRGFTEGLYLLLLFIAVDIIGLYYMMSAMIIQLVTAIIGYFVATKWIWRKKMEYESKILLEEDMDNERYYK